MSELDGPIDILNTAGKRIIFNMMLYKFIHSETIDLYDASFSVSTTCQN